MPHASLLPTATTHGRRHVHPAGITKHLRSAHHRSLDLSSLPEPWLGAPREHSQYFARPSAADLAPSRPRAASAAMPLSHDVTTSVTCRTSSFYSDDDLDAAAWQSVDRAAMTYSNGRLIYDDADAHKPILAPLTEAALLSHAGNHVQSRFSSSPVVVSAFSFSDIGSREHSSASDILIDYEMVLQPSPVKSNSWNVDFCEIGDAVLLRNARTVPPAAVSQHMVANEMMRFPAADDSVAISVGNPHTSLQSQPHQHAGSPVELCPLASWEDPSPKPPVCTPEYKKLAGHLSEWAAEMILRLVRGPGLDAAFQAPTLDSHGRRKDTVGAPTLLLENIRYCLMSTLLQPSVVFLAMYYICKLPVFARAGSQPSAATQRFRNAVFGDDAIGPQIKNEYELYAPFKVFVNGVLLASKTLDDATFSNRVWHEISRVPVQEINAIELASLELLSYDLTVAAEDWTTWLELLRNNHIRRAPYPAPIGPLGQTPHGALLQVFETLIAANTSRPHNAFDGPVFLGLQERIDERLKVLRVWFNVDEDLDEDGPLRDEYRPHSHSTPTVVSPFRMAKAPPPDLPPPAEWLPEADPIVSRPQRSSRPVWPDMGAYHPEQPIYQLPGGVAFPSGNGFGYAAAYHPQVGSVYAPYNPQQQPQQPSYQFNIYRTCCV